MKSFQEASVDKKVEMIPTKLLEDIKLGQNAQIYSDEHTLVRIEPKKGKEDSYKFVCAKIKELSKCLSGIDHEDKSLGLPYYKCVKCDTTRCETCVKVDIVLSRHDR